MKARNKLDGAIYAGTPFDSSGLPFDGVDVASRDIVKKVKLRAEGNEKILREVTALSKLSHRFIVRYYTTWREETTEVSNNDSLSGSESGSGPNSIGIPEEESGSDESDSGSDADFDESDSGGEQTDDGMTSVPNSHNGSSRRRNKDKSRRRTRARKTWREGSVDLYSFDMSELDVESQSRSSFPSIHFTGSGSGHRMVTSDEEISSDEQDLDGLGVRVGMDGGGIGDDGMDFEFGTPHAESGIRGHMASRISGSNGAGLLKPPATGHPMARLLDSPGKNGEVVTTPPGPKIQRTLYIQMVRLLRHLIW